MKFKGFINKQQMYLVLKHRNVDRKYIRFLDCDGLIGYTYLWMPDSTWYCQDVVGGIMSSDYSKENRKYIECVKKEWGLYEPNNDGMLYEIDTFPIFKDSIKFPITEVEVLDEEGIIRYKLQEISE